MDKYRVQWRDGYAPFETYEDAEKFAIEQQKNDPTTRIVVWDEKEEAWVVI